MGLSNWLPELPFNITSAEAGEESSTGPHATSSGAGVDDSDHSSEGPDQPVVPFDPNAARIVLPMEPEQDFAIFAGQELPDLPQPYVNPLAGMMDRPDPELGKEEKRDAYAEIMERFQVGDLEAPLEPKSYWSTETGPVTREDFNEYKAWTEDQIRRANALSLESASTLWKRTRELARERTLREETEKTLMTRPPVQSGTMDRWISEDRGALREPKYTEPDNTEEREAERGQFLYQNRSWRMKELRVTTLLLHAMFAIEIEEYSKALDCLYEAQKLAVLFEFPAFEARCEFWRGRAEFGMGSYATALAAFQNALPCEGLYREGLEVKDWIRRAQSGLGDAPEPRMRTRSVQHRSQRRRPRPDSFDGGAEHPPVFDPDDESNNDEDNDTREPFPRFGLDDEPDAGESRYTGEPRTRLDLGDEFDDDEDNNTGEHPPAFGAGDKSDDDQDNDTEEHPPAFGTVDEFDDDGESPPGFGAGNELDNDEDDNAGEHPPGFGPGDESNAGEDLHTRARPPRFSMDEEFDDGQVLNTRAAPQRFSIDEFDDCVDGNDQTGQTSDEEIINEALRAIELLPDTAVGEGVSGSSSAEATTATASEGKGRAIEDDFDDEDEQGPPPSG